MPESIIVQGQQTFASGIYGAPNVSELSGSEPGQARLAVVGDFPWLEQAVPKVFGNDAMLVRFHPTKDDVRLLRQLVYDATTEDGIGVPSALLLCNATPCTQAVRRLYDTDSTYCMVLKSVLWGPDGNRCHVTVEDGTNTGKKVTITRTGEAVETWDDVGFGHVLSFLYEGDVVTTLNMTFNVTDGLRVTYAKTLAVGTFEPAGFPFDGTIAATPSAAPGASEAHTLTVSGINRATGLADEEVLTWTTGQGGTKTTTKAWSAVTSLVVGSTDNTPPTIDITGRAFDLSPAAYPLASDLVDRVNQFPGFTATVENPIARDLATTDLDSMNGADSILLVKYLDADRKAVMNTINLSAYVTAEAAGTGSYPPANVSGYLAGGTATTANDDDWSTALAGLEDQDVDIVYPRTSTASRHTLAVTHCRKMAGIGANERTTWSPAGAGEALDALATRVKALNSKFTSVVFQGAEVNDYRGTRRALTPVDYGLMCASIEAGLPEGKTMLRRRPNVLRTTCASTIRPTQDKSTLIQMGLFVTVNDALGVRFERAVTTWLQDNNPALSERYAVWSVNQVVKGIRGYVEGQLGDTLTTAQLGEVKAAAQSWLERYKGRRFKDWIPGSLAVEDLGTAWRLKVQLAALEPNNFGLIEPYIRRIAA